MSFAGVFLEVLRGLWDVVRYLTQRKIEGREGLKKGLRVGMEAAMMLTFISSLWHNPV